MSLNRVAAAHPTCLIRAAQWHPLANLPSVCPQCLRKAQYRPLPRQNLIRRPFVSAAEHRPRTLEPNPTPPKAVGPDTSITMGDPSRYPVSGQDQQAGATGTADDSISKNEARQSSSYSNAGPAVGSVATSDPTPSDKKPRRRALRPRKAALTLSRAAVEQLQYLLDQPDPKFIRVGVKNRGCSGLAYHLEYVEKPGKFDEAVDQDGVRVLVDSKALFSIIGSEMDWIEDKLSRRFVFKNPNITEQCGCGESFSIS